MSLPEYSSIDDMKRSKRKCETKIRDALLEFRQECITASTIANSQVKGRVKVDTFHTTQQYGPTIVIDINI